MSKFRSGVSANRKSSRRQIVPEEQIAHCSTSHFQPDVTFGDCDESSRFIPGSLGAMSPSSRGHTMKECEEQLSQLHKENFNLKLRIYFLEERLGHRGPAAAGTEAGTCEATLRAEVESLRVELADKQQLLCQAASAIDLVEKKHAEELRRLEGEAASQRAELEGRLALMHKTSSEQCQQLRDEVARVSDLLSRQREDSARQPGNCTSVGTQCTVDDGGAAELSRQLEARGRQVAEAEQRIRGLEEALCEKQPEIQIKVQELRERDNVIEEKQNQLEQQNRVLVEIQITLAEKQRLIDALNGTISARDARVAQLEAGLEAEAHELGRARAENEMLKTQLKRMNRSREEPRRRGTAHSRESLSPRNKSLIEEAIEGIWSAPVLRTRDEFLPFEEKENVWKANECKEKPQQVAEKDRKSDRFSEENYLKPQQVAEKDRKSDRFSEENYLKLEKEHQRGCEAIQGFITRIKHLANEKEALKREGRRMRLELKELRDSYNKAKWEARQLEADATGVPGTLVDVRDMTEEENERLWAEVEDKNKKLAQFSLEMDKQIQSLLASLKEKEAQLTACEARLATSECDLVVREKYISELEGKRSQPARGEPEVVDKRPAADPRLWSNELQGSLDVAFRRRQTEAHEVETKERRTETAGGFVGQLRAEGGGGESQRGPIRTTAERDDQGRHDAESDRLRGQLCAAEVGKKNATNACALLVGRLEELAGFLVSLLARPGSLDTTHRRYIKQAVQRSVDLSRQLSVSVSLEDNDLAGSMMMDLSLYLEGVDGGSVIPVTSCSTDTLDELCGLDQTADLVARLRSQVETLKLEIKQRDIELNCLVQEHNLLKLSSPLFDLGDSNLPSKPSDDSTDRLPYGRARREASESETWSEPDRQISLARIGLPEGPITRHHHSRSLPEPVESSESSQETTRETNRTPGKRRGEAMELRRLQARLRGLEQVNEALRTELAILHQVTPGDSPENNAASPQTTATPPSISPPVENPIVVPAHLLEQIKHQREKLESSLFHNDFIRRQLEDVFLSATGGKSDQRTGSMAINNIDTVHVEGTGSVLINNRETVRFEEAGLMAINNPDMVCVEGTGLMAVNNPDKVVCTEGTGLLTTDNRDMVCVEGTSLMATDNRDTVRVLEAKLRAAEATVVELEGRLSEVECLLAESRTQAARVVLAEERCSGTQEKLSAMEGRVNELEVGLQERDAVVKAKEGLVAELEGEVRRLVQEIAGVRVEAERRVAQAEEKLNEAKEVLMKKVEGIEREIGAYEEKNRDVEMELKQARENLKEAMLQKVEANKVIEMMKVEFSNKIREREEAQRNLEVWIERTKEENEKEVERRSNKLEEAEKQLVELRWACKVEMERKVTEVERVGREVEAGLKRRAEVAERKVAEVEDLRREAEKRCLDQGAALRRLGDEAALVESRSELDRTRLVNEKVRLEQEARRREDELGRRAAELEQRVVELETDNAELKLQLERLRDQGHLRAEATGFPRDNGYMAGRGWNQEARPRSPEPSRSPLSSLVLQRGFGRQHSEFSDYVSEDQEFETVVTRSCSSYWITTVTNGRSEERGNVHSPDLGIESDQGRLSSLEVERQGSDQAAVQTFKRGRSDHNCTAIEQNNAELKRELCQTRRALEETLAQLTASNHRKQNVEKAICRQLQKTHSILMKTRGNLQPDSLALCDDQT